ncbi:MAG: hypothetical protein KW793_02095 [Candidatus Doudnabacteria bacterium]|nr:hypothetical protein [Candidatus Doudnabacteria bacterium]
MKAILYSREGNLQKYCVTRKIHVFLWHGELVKFTQCDGSCERSIVDLSDRIGKIVESCLSGNIANYISTYNLVSVPKPFPDTSQQVSVFDALSSEKQVRNTDSGGKIAGTKDMVNLPDSQAAKKAASKSGRELIAYLNEVSRRRRRPTLLS